jgi:hypothetical protein
VTPAIDARGARRAIGALAVAALLVAACGGSVSAPPSATGTRTPPASQPAPTDEPSQSGTPTEEPTPELTPKPTASAEATPLGPSGSPVGPSGSPGATASPGAADGCTGNDGNRAFYAGVAADVAWDVYCPVLPAGWFVETGRFRLSGGGTLEISYKGPGGQRIAIREGHYCAGQTGCIPAGPDAGTASFGGRPARLVDAGGGAWLVVADGGDGLSWEATGTRMDGPTLAGYTAAFVKVGE